MDHVLDPIGTFKRAFEELRPGGTLFGETPDTGCWDFRIFGRYWGWCVVLVILCLPLTVLQALFSLPATIAFDARKPVALLPRSLESRRLLGTRLSR